MAKKIKRIKKLDNQQEEKPNKLNLACGNKRYEGFLGVDMVKTDAVDIVCDLSKFPLPWEDNSIDEIICEHYVEHAVDLIGLMDELYRILKPGGKLTITAPYYTSMRACQDPTHVRSICEATFLYFNKQWRDSQGLSHYGIKSDFDFSYGYVFYPEWAQRSQEARDFALKHYWNVVSDIQLILVKREG